MIQNDTGIFVDRESFGHDELGIIGYIPFGFALITLVYFSFFTLNIESGSLLLKKKSKKLDTLFDIALDRILRWEYNWEHETLRSSYETCSFITAGLLAFSETNGNFVATLTTSTLVSLGSIFLSNIMGLGVTSPSFRTVSLEEQGRFYIGNFMAAIFSLWKAFGASHPVISIAIAMFAWIAMACLTELLINHYNADIHLETKNKNVELPLLSKWSIVVKVTNCLFGKPTGKKSEFGEVTINQVDEASLQARHDRQIIYAKAARGRTVTEMIKGKKWVILEGYVFDVEKFASHHPGGTALLLDYANRQADITDQFATFHHPMIYRRLLGMTVGKLQLEKDNSCSDNVEVNNMKDAIDDYRKLSAFLWANGYFDGAEADEESARVTLYRHLGLLCLAILTVFQVIILRYSMTKNHSSFMKYSQCVLAAITLGMFLQQAAFLAHDACHNCVVNRTKEVRSRYDKIIPNNFLGWFHGSVIFGISSARWIDDHSVHHAMTMRPMEDAQFKYLPIWCASRKEFESKTWLNMRKDFPPIIHITKCLLYVQHYTLLPLAVVIGRFNFYIINIVYAIQNGIIYDLVGMGLYWCGLISLISLLRQDIWQQVVFTLVSHATVGILHVQLLVNHLATDAFTAEEEAQMGWFAFQMRTTRNIDSTKNWDWFHGGLQYQIEHHLFPQLPRHRLPLIKQVLMEMCARHGLKYESVPLFESIKICLANFREIADEVWSGDLAIA